MKLLGLLLLMLSICVSCKPPQTVNQREADIYHVLQKATAKQQQDFEYFTTVILKDVHPDSLVSKNNAMMKAAAQKSIILIQKLEKTLIEKAGKGTNPETKLPKRPQEVRSTAKLIKAQIAPIKQSLAAYVGLIKQIGKDVPLPDLKTWEGNLYVRYFEGATLMKSLIMLQQMKNDVWHNANLVSQRTSYQE